MQYSVPQFIDVEDKIVGPFTAKQTLYLIIGGGILLLVFSFFEFMFFIFAFVIVVPLTLAFAFWKPKGFTVARWLSNGINFTTTSHLYVWRREPDLVMFKQTQKKAASNLAPAKNISRSRIRELSWLLDTSTSINLSYEAKTRPDETIFRR